MFKEFNYILSEGGGDDSRGEVIIYLTYNTQYSRLTVTLYWTNEHLTLGVT